jgi:hypothetical protein
MGAPVVVHDPLGATRGARGVVDGDDLVLVLEPGLDLVLASLLEQRVELRGEVDAAHRRGDLGEQRRQLGRMEDPARTGVLDDVRDVAGGQPGVHGDEDAARLGHGEVREEQRLAVEGEEGDAVVLAQPGTAQCRREPAGAPSPLRVGEPALTVDDGEPLPVDGAGTLEEGDGRELVAEDALSTAGLGDHATTLITASRRVTRSKRSPPRMPRRPGWAHRGWDQLFSTTTTGVIASTRRTA